MPSTQIDAESELQAALDASSFLLFKHSYRCPISLRAFREYQIWVEANPDAVTGWIDVVGERALSLAAASRTGIGHESPQAILLRDGRPVWNASHGAITRASLADALRAAGV